MDQKYFKKYVKPNLDTKYEEEEFWYLLDSPQRDLSKNKKVINYIFNHGVYITLTSSPTRLKKASTTLSMILQNKYIKKVYVTLPKLYRNKEPYNISDINFIKGMDKRITIKRPAKDIGPITKMLPTLSSMKDENSLVISIDDDIGYPSSLINELIYYSVMYPDTIFTGAGFRWGDDGYPDSRINRKEWPVRKTPRYPYVDIVEGWGGIVYKKRLVNTRLLRKLSNLNIDCKLSDDLTISYVFALEGVKMKVIVNKYYNDQEELYSFEYGLQEDALHRGSGLEEGVENANILKYKRCLKVLNDNIGQYEIIRYSIL